MEFLRGGSFRNRRPPSLPQVSEKPPFGSAYRSFADRGTSSLQIDLQPVYRAATKE
jgi:hypothetical protein